MINNEKQFKSTKAVVAGLREGFDAINDIRDVHPMLVAAQHDALASQINELERELANYEALRDGEVTTFAANGLHELPDILIRARIARGMSQRDLAEFLGLKEQQIQRYEAERYRSASLDRLVEIADALHVQITNRGELIRSAGLEKVDPEEWRSFPIAEMFKRGWFEDFTGTLTQARKAAPELLPLFFSAAHSPWTPQALHRRTVRAGGQTHEPALAAWEARVRLVADRSASVTPFRREAADAGWLGALVHLSAAADGPTRAIEHLRHVGIVLVVEPHLPGTSLDGAAMKNSSQQGIVGLTLRHDRLDNFWFTLLHEIAHLKLHVGDDIAAIFDDTESPARSEIEAEADRFAQEALLPEATWRRCLSRFTRTEKAVLTDARNLEISPAIIAGRIRREANDYTILRGLVGSGEPKRQLTE